MAFYQRVNFSVFLYLGLVALWKATYNHLKIHRCTESVQINIACVTYMFVFNEFLKIRVCVLIILSVYKN